MNTVKKNSEHWSVPVIDEAIKDWFIMTGFCAVVLLAVGVIPIRVWVFSQAWVFSCRFLDGTIGVIHSYFYIFGKDANSIERGPSMELCLSDLMKYSFRLELFFGVATCPGLQWWWSCFCTFRKHTQSLEAKCNYNVSMAVLCVVLI